MRDVFVGTSAYVGRIYSDTRCAFWPTDPRKLATPYDDTKLVEVDLANTVENATQNGTLPESVQVEPVKTTIGPLWPSGPTFIGRAYLHEGYWKSLPADRRPPCPPIDMSGEDYEFMFVVYRPNTNDPRSARRYQGVKAEIVTQQGSRAEIDIIEPGRSKAVGAVRKRIVVDLESIDVCEPPSSAKAPQLGINGEKRGMLFLSESRMFEGFHSWPKLPPTATAV